MSGWTDRVRRSWAAFVGPEASPTTTVVTLAAGGAGLIGGAWSARRRGAGPATTTVIALLGFDLGGGVYVNNTRACARWYERPVQGTREHLAFAALHVHPAAIAYADRSIGAREDAIRWSLAHYGYMMAAATAIRLLPQYRRPLGVVLTSGGLLLDRVLGSSQVAGWFAGAYYPKLLMGHAAASLWTDEQLHAPPPPTLR